MKTLSLAIAAALALGASQPAAAAANPNQIGPTFHCAPAAAHVPCSAWLPYTGLAKGAIAHKNFTAFPWTLGTTKAAITAKFAFVLLWDFTYNPAINTQITNMPDNLLAAMSHAYYVQNQGNMAPLLNVAASKLSGANLRRLSAAFGVAQVNAAVTAHAPVAIVQAYVALPAHPLIKMSQAHYASLGLNATTANGLVGGPSATGLNQAWTPGATAAAAHPEEVIIDGGYVPAPSPTMAITDIYLEYYCAGVGTTVTEATVMTAQYLDGPVGLAFSVGYGIGTGIYLGTEYLKPGFFEDVIEFLGTPVTLTVDDQGGLVGTVTVGEPIQQPDSTGGDFVQYDFQQDD